MEEGGNHEIDEVDEKGEQVPEEFASHRGDESWAYGKISDVPIRKTSGAGFFVYFVVSPFRRSN